MYKRMLRSVLVTVFGAAALLLVANVSPPDVGWGSVQAGAVVDLRQADVGWGSAPTGAAVDLHQDDVGWGSSPVNLAGA